jgi:hypothetical protein
LGYCWGGDGDGAAGQGSEESQAEFGHFEERRMYVCKE